MLCINNAPTPCAPSFDERSIGSGSRSRDIIPRTPYWVKAKCLSHSVTSSIHTKQGKDLLSHGNYMREPNAKHLSGAVVLLAVLEEHFGVVEGEDGHGVNENLGVGMESTTGVSFHHLHQSRNDHINHLWNKAANSTITMSHNRAKNLASDFLVSGVKVDAQHLPRRRNIDKNVKHWCAMKLKNTRTASQNESSVGKY